MNRDDIQKLLGGYATRTLTPDEQQALFEAALDDQQLFDALAREQALRDLLRDTGQTWWDMEHANGDYIGLRDSIAHEIGVWLGSTCDWFVRTLMLIPLVRRRLTDPLR